MNIDFKRGFFDADSADFADSKETEKKRISLFTIYHSAWYERVKLVNSLVWGYDDLRNLR